jgi:hypothetical protein
MKKSVVLSMTLLVFLVIGIANGSVFSQDDTVVPRPDRMGESDLGPFQNEDGLWFMPTGGQVIESDFPQLAADSGGPDDFGYTWMDVGLNWISASGGVDTGLGAAGYPDYTGAIDIGFPFNFYENTFNYLYISRYGFLSFDNTNLWNEQSQIPSPEPPNDVIAPHWVPADGATYVRYLRGGSAPNRWFVVEWNQLYSDYDEELDVYTFETILYESGDILFQYAQMNANGGWWCQSGGIEDMTGLDGLEIKPFCQEVASNHAVRISRPPAAARVRLSPSYGGSFAHAGQVESIEIVVRNTGELGSDTYDLFPTSSAWNAMLYEADGVTPLTDTDGDSIIDTGPINQASQKIIVAKVQTPSNAVVGDDNTLNVLARSSVNIAVSRTAQIRTAVPTRFGLISMDYADHEIDLSLFQPAGRTEITLSPDNHYGYDLAVTNTPDGGFFSAWTRGRYIEDNVYVREIVYSVANKYGEVVLPAVKLTRHNNVSISTYDIDPAIAVAPDGKIGLLWYRYLYNRNTGLSNYNVYFAVLSPNGTLISGPVNLTGNTSWGYYNTDNVPKFFYPSLAVTGDNHFVYTWEKSVYQGGEEARNIFYGVRNSNGAQIRGVTALTNAQPGWSYGYTYPNLATLSNNRVMVSISSASNADILAGVLDSIGNMVIGLKNISLDGTSSYDYQSDAVQLANGNILASWYGNSRIHYTLLNSSLNTLVTPLVLYNNAALVGENYVSVTTGPGNTGVLTWLDNNYDYRPNLYYALVDGAGTLVTAPVIIQSSEARVPQIESSFNGYGNAEYTWVPPTESDSTLDTSQTIQGASPGGGAVIFAEFANYGESVASGLTLTATLDSHLTYTGDDSGITPTITNSQMLNSETAVAETVTWMLPDMRLFDRDGFSIFVDLAVDAPIGSSYPVTLTLMSTSDDADISNNEHIAMVWSSYQVYLPVVSKPFD